EGEHEKALVAAKSGLQSGALDQEAYKRYREEIAAADGADAEMSLRDLLEAPSYDDAGILLQQGLSWFGEELNQPLKQKLTAAAAAWVEEKVAELKEAEAYQEAYTAVNQLFEAGVLEAVVLDECKQDLEGSVIAGVEQAIRSGSYAEAYRILDSGVEEFLAVASLRELVETAEEEALLVEDLEAGLSVVVEARKGTQYGSVEAVTERMQLSEAVVVLEQERGNLAVLTGEDGLKILLDGESYGETGSGVLEDVAAGRYEVKITGGGWYYRGPVEIAAEETTWVLPELQAVGMLEVQAHVSGSVEIRGEKPVHLEAGDVYLSEQVPVGTTQVSFRYANGLQEIRELTIEQGERSTVGFSKTFGTLKLSVATGGTVYVDGKLKGVLEGGNTEDLGWLETGLRRIEIEYADGLREIQQVEIEQGESTNSIVFTRTFGEVAVRTATAGKVYLEGEEEELELSAGDRKVFPMTESGKRIVHIEYVNGMRESRDIIVHPDQSTTVEFTKTFGQVMISAAAEGELFIDRERQQSLGAGTEVVLDLETGERLVELHHPEGPVEARMVDLSSGETAEVIFSTIYGALLVSAATAGTLSIDGAAYGDVEAGSELELTGIETGERSIEIRYESGKTETQLVEIGSGATPEISFSTTFGGLQVRTAASGTVLVDGEEQGLLQAGGDLELTGIETGTRNVEFRYGNGMREAKDVVVREGTQHRVLFNAVYGKVSVRSETAGTVYADGERVRSITAGISEDLGWLEMGLRRIEIEYANGVREQQRVLVHEGERGSTVVFTKSFGDISVRTASYGRIYLDGNDEAAAAGREHLFEMLETGEHRITVEYPNGKRVEREVMVEPDQSVEVVFEEQFGSVQVRTATAGTVLIDGREILQLGAGETLTLTAQTGRRTISIDYGSGNREERTVAIDGDRVPSIAFEKEYGTIEVRSRSAGTIIIDGREAQNVGADKLIKLDMVEAGRRKLEIVYWNDYSENQTIEVRPQQSVPIEFDYQAVPLTYVEGGSFEMYTPYNHLRAATADSSVPLYIVQVNSFYIGTFEVTQDVYTQVMGNNPSRWKGDRLPVEQVSWFEAVEFCNALSRLEGRQEAYTIIGDVSVNWESNGYRLPTEAEWEYAARGGVKSGGYTYLGSNSAEDVAWFFRNSGKRTHPVGDKQPNELGLFDMGGNVSEWCWDWFDRDYYRNSSRENPTGPDSGSSRVLRGGAWNNWRTNIDADERGYDSPSKKYSTNGFRVLVPAVQGPL
ncbi:MAG: SUMF1/EgtB/PvdO family nonheme iron enzyme, partial [Spirochaetales bacterium]|nr:SUMF1/EgtB/PvdO family nonheme iron enzyme [Spirochaetales bacterium]